MASKRWASCLLAAAFLLGATTCNAQLIFHKKKKVNKSTSADNNAQPDKILYDRAMDDIKHGRQEIGRLNMQTLINTYPDSEYLAKAKLAIADSYYKEGGTANLALAISGYKDFIVFFPFLPEATYAQMQVAMAHYRQMEKPDRDRTQALDAEEEFQTFLEKYPNDPLAPQAQQHLREVQEVLAEGDYRIGYYYYVKGDRRAAAARLLSVAARYPLYSKSDHVLWMMGDIFEKSERKEIASLYYARIVKDYPLSSLVPGAKDKLKASGTPIPQPDPTALAWMTAEQNTPRQHHSLVTKPLGLLKSGPGSEIMTAARTGAPNLQPESDSLPGGELLTPGGKTSVGTPGTGVVATVVPGSTPATGETVPGSESAAPPSDTSAPPTSDPPKDPAAAAAATAAPGSSPAATAAAAANDAPKADPAAPGTNPKPDAASSTTAPEDSAKPADAASAVDAKSDPKDKDKKESSSKKKKGLRKIVPW
ncbi:MAG TPA: outer membrane protein assembly factor BamD [Candidatus Methylomirabilis sp.]|nr:outer membrane protein assembly factor BamD [Candidatus Methylomirabilis sp.]